MNKAISLLLETEQEGDFVVCVHGGSAIAFFGVVPIVLSLS